MVTIPVEVKAIGPLSLIYRKRAPVLVNSRSNLVELGLPDMYLGTR
jgi:hypothetical protein